MTIEFLGLVFAIVTSVVAAVNYLVVKLFASVDRKIERNHDSIRAEFQRQFHSTGVENQREQQLLRENLSCTIEENKDNIALLSLGMTNLQDLEAVKREHLRARVVHIERFLENGEHGSFTVRYGADEFTVLDRLGADVRIRGCTRRSDGQEFPSQDSPP